MEFVPGVVIEGLGRKARLLDDAFFYVWASRLATGT